MRQLVDKMEEIRHDNQVSLKEIVDLGGKSKEITRIMEIIDTVADQTKLIAFNAALEASSAGEAGKRFGVVAAEIRRLADSVSESTAEIAHKIGEIQETIGRLVITSEKGSVGIDQGTGCLGAHRRLPARTGADRQRDHQFGPADQPLDPAATDGQQSGGGRTQGDRDRQRRDGRIGASHLAGGAEHDPALGDAQGPGRPFRAR
jgi:hypothetical protein